MKQRKKNTRVTTSNDFIHWKHTWKTQTVRCESQLNWKNLYFNYNHLTLMGLVYFYSHICLFLFSYIMWVFFSLLYIPKWILMPWIYDWRPVDSLPQGLHICVVIADLSRQSERRRASMSTLILGHILVYRPGNYLLSARQMSLIHDCREYK
jgi:hypothetical protein